MMPSVDRPAAHTRDPTAPLLKVSNARTAFRTTRGPLRAVDGVSFELNKGDTFAVVGESGSGKSVLVRTIMNLLGGTGYTGLDTKIEFDGRDLDSMTILDTKRLWGNEISMVFQDPMSSLNPVRRIGIQVTESMRLHRGMSKAAAKARAIDLLNEVGIPEPERRLEQYPHELSGGMRQRIVIAIALACEPRLLIADEPTTALDVTVQKQILELLRRLQREHGMAMILISHDLAVVAGMADRVAVMYGGQIMEVAATSDLFANVRHPYTEALLNSIPRPDLASHSRLQPIEGRPPDMVSPPGGCRFAPRCRYAQARCLSELPDLETRGPDGHETRCFFPVDTEAGREALAANLLAGTTAAGLKLDNEVLI